MDLSTITVADFKAQFPRDFPYLPVFDNAALYNIADRVYYPTTKLFYDCKLDGTTGIIPTNTTNWTRVTPQPSVDDYVQDADITRAFAEAMVNFNQALFTSDAQIKMAFLYLTAHYLVNDLRAAQGGVTATPIFLVESRTVGNVSESYGIPEKYLNNPVFSYLTTTPYGLKYLSFVIIKLVGNVGAVGGWTQPL